MWDFVNLDHSKLVYLNFLHAYVLLVSTLVVRSAEPNSD